MSETVTILGLESSCDDTAASVVRHMAGQPAQILSSIVFDQSDLHADFGGVSLSFNTGHSYDAYVQYDDYGAVIQIENVPIYYDYYGRVIRAGNVRINYNNYGRISRVGGLYVYYNRYNNYSHYSGYINAYNRQ